MSDGRFERKNWISWNFNSLEIVKFWPLHSSLHILSFFSMHRKYYVHYNASTRRKAETKSKFVVAYWLVSQKLWPQPVK